MLVVTGFFENETFIPDKPVLLPQRKRVVVTIEEETLQTSKEKNTRRQEAFQYFMQYKGTLPADFDYKKELEDFRNERYGCID